MLDLRIDACRAPGVQQPVTVIEARSVLEVDAATRGSDLRRAYLRKVKAHPPERDPTEFARIREAFELLKQLDDSGIDVHGTDVAWLPSGAALSASRVARAEPVGVAELGAQLDTDALDIDFELCVNLILTLEAEERLAEARTLLDALNGHLERMSAELKLGTKTALKKNAALELTRLPTYARFLRSAMAKDLLHLDAQDATGALRAAVHNDQNRALSLYHFCSQHAPLLFEFFNRELFPPRKANPLGQLLLACILGLPLLCSWIGDDKMLIFPLSLVLSAVAGTIYAVVRGLRALFRLRSAKRQH